MEKPIAKYKNSKGDTLAIWNDTDPINPRGDWDNFGSFMVKDSCPYVKAEADCILNFYSRDADEKLLEKAGYIFLPVYVLDHSGVSMSTKAFGCPWDSGQIGYYVVAKEKVRKEFNKKVISSKLRQKVLDILNSEVELYNKYLNGDVYGYTIENANGVETDSCWGYYDIKDILEDYPEFTEELDV